MKGRLGIWTAAGIVLLAAASGRAVGDSVRKKTKADKGAVPAVAAVRRPEIRHLDKKKDAADLKRIWQGRKKLPEPFYRRNNFGWAWAEIDGLEKQEYFAHSGIQSLDDFSVEVASGLAGMSFSPEKGKGRFQTLLVDWRGNIGGPDALPRWFDTEYKMLEDIAARLPDPGVSGTIRLYTNLEPCPSCRGVMDQFLAIYTNVELVVFYEWPP